MCLGTAASLGYFWFSPIFVNRILLLFLFCSNVYKLFGGISVKEPDVQYFIGKK